MNNTEINGGFGFAIKITIANIFTYWLSTIPPMIIDPILTHSSGGARHYPYAWLIFPIGLALGVATLFIMTRTQKGQRVLWDGLSFSLATFLALPLFSPFPHGYVVVSGILFLLLSVLTVWIHNEPIEAAHASDKTIDRNARLEWVKEGIQFWRNGIIALVATYLALLVSWFNLLREASLRVSSDVGEQQWFEG